MKRIGKERNMPKCGICGKDQKDTRLLNSHKRHEHPEEYQATQLQRIQKLKENREKERARQEACERMRKDPIRAVYHYLTVLAEMKERRKQLLGQWLE